jgi:hypothetical protein
VFLAARERCERVREFVPASGPIPAEPGAGSINAEAPAEPPEPIVAAIIALREWIASAAAMLRRRSGDGPTRTLPKLLSTSEAARRVGKTSDAIRKASKRNPDKLREHRKPGDREVYFDRDELDRYYQRPPE